MTVVALIVLSISIWFATKRMNEMRDLEAQAERDRKDASDR